MLYFCRRLWGQSIVGAIFALLLHRWLLLRPEAGGLEQRQKHVHVLMLGARARNDKRTHGHTHVFAHPVV